jgi:hypothetical protein
MGPKAQSLVDTMTKLSRLLRFHGEVRWASWVEGDRDRIRQGDLSGVTHLLSAYYGVGNFSELVLEQDKGHRVDAAPIGGANDVLSNLRSRAWQLADAIAAEAGLE